MVIVSYNALPQVYGRMGGCVTPRTLTRDRVGRVCRRPRYESDITFRDNHFL